MTTPDSINKTLVWDLPTRVFHWFFVLCFIMAWITHENDRFLYEHVYAGYVFFGLLLFRLLWGWVGSHYAQFRSFAYDWPSVTSYLKGLLNGEAMRHVGHNPAGGWAIFIMLALGVLVSVTGLMVFGGEEGHGPLKGIVGYDLGSAAKEVHEVFAVAMLLVVFVHVVGVVVESFFHKENLIWAMISGQKPDADSAIQVRLYPLIAVIVLSLIVISATFYFRGYITQTDAKPYIPFSSPALPSNATWVTECGECHLAFHPSLLPVRSWQRLMQEQADHFGEDLVYDEETTKEISEFMVKNSAENSPTEAAHKINANVPVSDAPVRITETRYWKRKHEEIDEKYWKSTDVKSKTNCSACHLDAKTGWFEDSNMRLPKLVKEK